MNINRETLLSVLLILAAVGSVVVTHKLAHMNVQPPENRAVDRESAR